MNAGKEPAQTTRRNLKADKESQATAKTAQTPIPKKTTATGGAADSKVESDRTFPKWRGIARSPSSGSNMNAGKEPVQTTRRNSDLDAVRGVQRDSCKECTFEVLYEAFAEFTGVNSASASTPVVSQECFDPVPDAHVGIVLKSTGPTSPEDACVEVVRRIKVPSRFVDPMSTDMLEVTCNCHRPIVGHQLEQRLVFAEIPRPVEVCNEIAVLDVQVEKVIVEHVPELDGHVSFQPLDIPVVHLQQAISTKLTAGCSCSGWRCWSGWCGCRIRTCSLQPPCEVLTGRIRTRAAAIAFPSVHVANVGQGCVPLNVAPVSPFAAVSLPPLLA